LHIGESEKDVVLTGKIVKEGAFADVGGFSDVLDRRLGKAFLREKKQGGPEEAFADLGAAALAAGRGERFGGGDGNGRNGYNGLQSSMTVGHLL